MTSLAPASVELLTDYLFKAKENVSLPRLPPLCIMIPVPFILARFCKSKAIEKSSTFDFVTISVLKNSDRFVAGPFVGAPAAALVMERLILRGVRQFVLLGTCGSLDKEIGIGDIVVPTRGESEEGVSSLYGFPKAPPKPDPMLRASLVAASKTCPGHIHESGIWSTDAPYMETKKKVASYQAKGMGVVDMETTGLLSVAKKRAVRFASVLIVSDRLVSGKWEPGFYDKRFKKAVLRVIEITHSFKAPL
ncbi:MAG: nucleoside phosphorylase [Nitrospinota bacterium]